MEKSNGHLSVCGFKERKILNSVNEDILDDKKKKLILTLKYNHYNKLFMMYLPVRMKKICREILMELTGKK